MELPEVQSDSAKILQYLFFRLGLEKIENTTVPTFFFTAFAKKKTILFTEEGMRYRSHNCKLDQHVPIS